MNIDITRLKSGMVDEIEINEKVFFDENELKKVNIIKLDDVMVTGFITKSGNDDYFLNARVYGTMVLPCSLTLKPTNYKFETNIEGIIGEMLSEIGKNDKISTNTIDILPIIWENILVEIPMSVINEDDDKIKLKGEGWEVLTDEIKHSNPELEKLKDLLKCKVRC